MFIVRCFSFNVYTVLFFCDSFLEKKCFMAQETWVPFYVSGIVSVICLSQMFNLKFPRAVKLKGNTVQ